VGRQINNVDIVDVGFVYVFGRYVATVTVNNKEVLLVRMLRRGVPLVLSPAWD